MFTFVTVNLIYISCYHYVKCRLTHRKYFWRGFRFSLIFFIAPKHLNSLIAKVVIISEVPYIDGGDHLECIFWLFYSKH